MHPPPPPRPHDTIWEVALVDSCEGCSISSKSHYKCFFNLPPPNPQHTPTTAHCHCCGVCWGKKKRNKLLSKWSIKRQQMLKARCYFALMSLQIYFGTDLKFRSSQDKNGTDFYLFIFQRYQRKPSGRCWAPKPKAHGFNPHPRQRRSDLYVSWLPVIFFGVGGILLLNPDFPSSFDYPPSDCIFFLA